MREGITLHPAAFAPMPAVAAILARYDRPKLEAAIEVMIGLRDATDSDPEGSDQSWPEDLTARRSMARGHGDRIEDAEDDDPAEDEESPTDTAWVEQHNQTAPQPYKAAAVTYIDHDTGEAIGVLEDAEDDDAAEDDGEDACSAHDDGCGAVLIHGRTVWGSEHDQGITLVPTYGIDQTRGPVAPALEAVTIGNDA